MILVSCIYIRSFNGVNYNGVLLDCGEGSFGQFYRLFGPQNIESLINEIDV